VRVAVFRLEQNPAVEISEPFHHFFWLRIREKQPDLGFYLLEERLVVILAAGKMRNKHTAATFDNPNWRSSSGVLQVPSPSLTLFQRIYVQNYLKGYQIPKFGRKKKQKKFITLP